MSPLCKMLRDRCRGDGGSSAAISMMMVIPFFVGIINIAIVAGQLTEIQADLQLAAREGARVASLRNNPGDAESAGRSASLAVLADHVPTCVGPDARLTSDTVVSSTGTSGVDTNFGPGGSVTLLVECDIPLADLGVGIPFLGTKSLSAKSTEVLERYREFD